MSVFFDLELHKQKRFCCDSVCLNRQRRAEYFGQITQLIEYLILPPEVFANRTVRFFVRDLIVNTLLMPTVHTITEPDFINQALIKLCKTRRCTIPLSESFLHVIRFCSNVPELQAIDEMVDKEIAFQGSKDIGGDDDFEIKQQLSSLQYVKTLITSRLTGLQEGGLDVESSVSVDNAEITNFTNTAKMFQIPFEVTVKNNVALSYFFEYMSGINAQSYLNFYLNVDGFKTSAEQLLSEIALLEAQKSLQTDTDQPLPNIKFLREAAINIYETYLNPDSDSGNRLELNEDECRNVFKRINHESLSDKWFDQVHLAVYEKMRTDERMFPSFKKSIHYVKLLAELDLLKECNIDSFLATSSVASNANESTGGAKSVSENLTPGALGAGGDTHSADDNTSIKSFNSFDAQSVGSLDAIEPLPCTTALEDELSAEIISTGTTKEFGHTFGVYCISVCKRNNDEPSIGKENHSKWYVIRRYSDFYQFHQRTIKAFPQLNRLIGIPGKRPFNNVNQDFLNQRMRQLNAYLQQLLRLYNNIEYEQHYKFNRNLLRDHIFKFVDLNSNDGCNSISSGTTTGISSIGSNACNGTAAPTHSQLQKTVNSVLNPFKSSFKLVMKAGQDNLMDGFQKLKNLNNPSSTTSSTTVPVTPCIQLNASGHNTLTTTKNESKPQRLTATRTISEKSSLSLLGIPSVGSTSSLNDRTKASSPNVRYCGLQQQEPTIAMEMEVEPTNSIPIRILLLLLDEIFELRNKNFWLRGRIIAVVKQIIQTTYGGTINKKVIQAIHKYLGASAIADHIRSIKKSLWPNGYRALPQSERSEQVKLNTKTSALMLLLSTLPDDLKHLIGAETSRHGISTLFHMFQYPELNCRLAIRLFEGLLLELFPNQHLEAVFERLHSFSERVHNQSADQSPQLSSTKDIGTTQWPPYWSQISQHQVRCSSAQTSSSSKSSSSKSSPIKPINK